jgi:predicted nucleotidyltransferase component of viral defense system
MLQRSTIEPATLDLLRTILAIPELQNFYLVGGTALALRFGHRLSVDLDLFSTDDFEMNHIIGVVETNFPQVTYKESDSNIGFFCSINEVKVDLVKHHHFSLIRNPEEIEGIRMFSTQDIIAMKIAAILRRAQQKDFFDLVELLKHYPLQSCIDFYHEKYPSQQLAISIPYAISYFDDAENSPTPVSLNGQTWTGVKKFIQAQVREYLS